MSDRARGRFAQAFAWANITMIVISMVWCWLPAFAQRGDPLGDPTANFGIRDRIVTNTEKISDLERRMRSVEQTQAERSRMIDELRLAHEHFRTVEEGARLVITALAIPVFLLSIERLWGRKRPSGLRIEP